MKLVTVDVIKGYFEFNFSELNSYYILKEDVCFIDRLTENQMYLTPFDYVDYIKIDSDIEDLNTVNKVIKFDCNSNYATALDLTFLKNFHYTWYNELKEYLTSPDFKNLLSEIYILRKSVDIYPKQNLVFSEFLVPLNKVKGVWIGESPYPTYAHANGRAFATWNKERPKSLNILLKGIRTDLRLKQIEVNNDLVQLSSNGILFLNYSLIIDKNKKSINITLPFIKKVIEILNKKEKLSVIFLGSYARKLLPLFDQSFNLYTASHPISASYQNIEWNTNQVFQKFNEHVKIL